MWTDLYGGTAQDVADALESGPLVLSGLPGSGRAPLVEELAGRGPVVHVQPRQAGTLAGLKIDMLNELLEVSAAFAEATTQQDFQRLVATVFGPHAAEVLATVDRGEASKLSIAEILTGLPAGATLIVHDAHLLSALSDRALWAIRARAQGASPPRIALLTREWHSSGLVGPDAAFFGFGRTLHLPLPGVRDWARSTASGINEQELGWLLEQTRRLPRVTLAVLERFASAADVPTAWRAHVHEAGRVAYEIRRLAHGLHPYAPRLLTAIAAEDRVYRSVPEARSDAVAAALRAMRDHDLIYQPRPRKWLVADPALVPHLAAGA
jgi:hypothetical protein